MAVFFSFFSVFFLKRDTISFFCVPSSFGFSNLLHPARRRSLAMLKARQSTLKWVSLVLLVIQNTLLVLLMRYSRTRPRAEGELLYVSSTAVVCAEVTKVVISAGAFVHEQGLEMALATVLEEIQHPDMLKLAVPGLLYTIQNNLLFVALSNLPAAVYQITYQLKIITTAIMSVVLLNKTLNRYQMVSLLLLTIGVAMVQLANSSSSSGGEKSGQTQDQSVQSPFLGLVCVLLACLTSGFSGVYMEKVLKKGRPVPLYVRNIQLSLMGVVLGLFAVFVSDWQKVLENGFFQGYNSIVFYVVMLQAGGGLMIAVVMKYADNILKGFATSISIVLSTWISTILFNFHLTLFFMCGATIVMSAVFLYGYQPKKQKGGYLPLSAQDAGRSV